MLTLPMFLRQYEVADLLSVSKTCVQKYAKQGKLTPIKDGGRDVYYHRNEVLGLYEQKQNKR